MIQSNDDLEIIPLTRAEFLALQDTIESQLALILKCYEHFQQLEHLETFIERRAAEIAVEQLQAMLLISNLPQESLKYAN